MTTTAIHLAVLLLCIIFPSGSRISILATNALKFPTASTVSPPRGIQNLGNTCYMNAQLQCSYHIPLVRKYIMEKNHQILNNGDNLNHDNNADVEAGPATAALGEVFQDLSNVSSKATTAVATTKVLCAALGINPFAQQDSQEFWKLLLPTLNLKHLIDLYSGEYQNYIVEVPTTAISDETTSHTDDTNLHRRITGEVFLDISVDVSNHNTLQSSMHEMFQVPELLSVAEGNGWKPKGSTEKVNAHKGTRLLPHGLPSILQVHLKRFQFDWATETTTKINSRFQFPLTLNLSNIISSSSDDSTSEAKENRDNDSETTILSAISADTDDTICYELQSVIVHVGEYGSGHYYAYVRPDVRTNQWYRCNDHRVEAVSFQTVIQDAYGGENSSIDNDVNSAITKNENEEGNMIILFLHFIKRVLRFVFLRKQQRSSDDASSSVFGYGGKTSNAYVAQYVRRCDISKLYEGTSE